MTKWDMKNRIRMELIIEKNQTASNTHDGGNTLRRIFGKNVIHFYKCNEAKVVSRK